MLKLPALDHPAILMEIFLLIIDILPILIIIGFIGLVEEFIRLLNSATRAENLSIIICLLCLVVSIFRDAFAQKHLYIVKAAHVSIQFASLLWRRPALENPLQLLLRGQLGLLLGLC